MAKTDEQWITNITEQMSRGEGWPGRVYVEISLESLEGWLESMPTTVSPRTQETVVDLTFKSNEAGSIRLTPMFEKEDAIVFHVYKLHPYRELGHVFAEGISFDADVDDVFKSLPDDSRIAVEEIDQGEIIRHTDRFEICFI